MIIHQVIIVHQFGNQKNSTSIANRFGLKIVSNEMIQYRRMILVQIEFLWISQSRPVFQYTLLCFTSSIHTQRVEYILLHFLWRNFYGKVWQWSDAFFNFSFFFLRIRKIFSIHESRHLSLNSNAVIKETNLICGCYLWLLFNIRMVFGCWTQWCSKWDSMYEIEKEMCVLCVVWAKVLLLLEIDVIMCLYGQKFWECVCKEGKEKHRQSKKKESGREKWCSPIRPKT